MDSTQVEQWLQQRIASLLEVSVEEIDARSPLENFGLGSKDATGMVAELDSLLDVRLPATLLYEHETIQALAHHISQVARESK
jgi:polyketide synthase 13